MQLHLNNISFTYSDSASPTLVGATVVFPTGWTGIIGNNGCGKTTLANIALGIMRPDSGQVNPALLGSSCPQDTSVTPKHLEDFASDWSAEAIRIRSTLGIDDAWLWTYEHLSGGQKKRIQIGCALWSSPDVLVLDEPTNDLDAATREQIFHALASFKGIGILISHDRDLLDRLVKQCVVFEAGGIITRPGGYSKAIEQADAERNSLIQSRETARREEKRLQAELHRRNEEHARSKSRLSAKRLDKHDSDARERIGRAKVSSKDSITSRAVKTMSSRLQRTHHVVETHRIEKRYDPHIALPGKVSKAAYVAHVQEGQIHAGELTLSLPELWVQPTDHISITGNNGCGKTTLIRHLMGLIPDNIDYACIPQEVDARQRKRVLEKLHAADTAASGKMLSLVARLNSDPARIREGSDISPGEMKKLIIAENLLMEPHLLILDEPTNHLDVSSIEALQNALAAFPGALILVTHDDRLRAATCNISWSIERNGDESRLHAR